MPLTRAGMYRVMDNIYEEIKALREETGKAYAPNQMRPFQNFEEGAAESEISREQELWNRAYKHVIAVKMWIAAPEEHRIGMDAREPIGKRINDLINYLLILRAMNIEDRLESTNVDSSDEAIQQGLLVLGNKTPLTIVKDDSES